MALSTPRPPRGSKKKAKKKKRRASHQSLQELGTARGALVPMTAAPIAIGKPAQPEPQMPPGRGMPPQWQSSVMAHWEAVQQRHHRVALDVIGSARTPIALAVSAGNQGETAVHLQGQVGARAGTSVGISVTDDLPTAVIVGPDREVLRFQLGEIRDRLERLSPMVGELETAVRQYPGRFHNAGPPLAVQDVSLGIDAANVFRTELSVDRPRQPVMRLCFAPLQAIIDKLAPYLPDLKKGFVQGSGFALAKEFWQLLHELVAKIEVLLQHVQMFL